MNGCKYFIGVLMASLSSYAAATTSAPASISANPAAVNITTGNGRLQGYFDKLFGIKDNHGITFGGAWTGDANQLFSGGLPNPERTTLNSLLQLDLTVDTEKLTHKWKGGLFGAEFLQINLQNTNFQAGTVQGYNSLLGPPPLNRSELYQLWYRQTLFNDKFIIRIGKTVPTYDFGNVVKPVALSRGSPTIPAVSGLIFTPLYISPSVLGVMPGYYNSAYGITMSFAPVKEWYLSYGIYDGNLASGEQTGLHDLPTFNGANFQIAETGVTWLLGEAQKPGTFGIGAWHQHGEIKAPPGISENNTSGYYFFGSQRLWYKNPGADNSGVSGYYTFGYNRSNAMLMNRSIGAGLTAFGLVSKRPDDSFGAGASYAWINTNNFHQPDELLLQAYYQAEIINGIYLEPAISYIPTPAANNTSNNAWAGTVRAIVLF